MLSYDHMLQRKAAANIAITHWRLRASYVYVGLSAKIGELIMLITPAKPCACDSAVSATVSKQKVITALGWARTHAAFSEFGGPLGSNGSAGTKRRSLWSVSDHAGPDAVAASIIPG